MKTIYKFGYKINSDGQEWIDSFKTLFGVDFSYQLLSKDIKLVIKSERLEIDLLKEKINEIETYSNKHKKKRLYLITEMLIMVTTHVILNLDKDCEQVDCFVDIINGLK